MTFDVSWLGVELQAVEFRANTVRLAQFAAATNDTNPRHASGEVAPPVFATIPPMQAAMEVLSRVTQLPRLHGAQDIRFHESIRPGARLFPRAVLHGVLPTPAGVSVIIRSVTCGVHGQLYDEQFLTVIVPGVTLPRGYGTAAPAHKLEDRVRASPPLASACFAMSEDQTRRYADASRDYSDYTVRSDAARARGFGGLLVHGLLTLAFASRAIVQHACAGDSAALRRLACRFTAPVILAGEQSICTRLWQLAGEGTSRSFGFESSDASGALVIRHGLAEVRS